MSLNPNGAPAGYYYQAGATACLIDPAGTYSLAGAPAPTPADPGTYIPFTGATSEAVEIVDPAGTYSGPGASAPTPADAGAYIPGAGATSEAVEIVVPAGTYSGPGASAPTPAAAGTYIPGAGATSAAAEIVDPAGTYSNAGASTPADPGTYIPVTGASSVAAEIDDPAGTYSAAGASAATTDPAGTYSGAEASAPTLAAAGTYIPVTGATSAAAEIVSPAGTYCPAGASAPIADPGGTYSARGASAPTTDPAGTYSSPYALNRLFLVGLNNTPDNAVLSFNSATAVANYYGATSREASLANEFFAGYGGTSATMLFTRYGSIRRPHLLGANISNLTLNQLQSISGSLAITFQGYTYSGPINLSGVESFQAAASAIQAALNSHLQVAAVTAGSSITPVSVSFTGSLTGAFIQVTSVSSGSIELGAQLSGPGIRAGNNQIVAQLNGTPGGAGLYTLYVGAGTVSSETMTETYGVLTVGAVTSGTVAVGQKVTGAGVLPLTAIDGNLSGSGPGSTWLVNNAQTVAGENITTTATPLTVVLNWNNQPIIGATENNDFFDVSPNGDFGYNNNPSSLSYMSGTAAAALGLTQASGAINSTPGGQHPTVSEFMNNLVQNEYSQFGSFQNNIGVMAQGSSAIWRIWRLGPSRVTVISS